MSDEAIAHPEQPIQRLVDRNIYSWVCRGTLKRSDPMAVQRRMSEAASAIGFNPAGAVTDLRVAQSEFKVSTDTDKQSDNLAALRAQGNLAAMTRAGFNLTDIEVDEENGWTEDECLDLLEQFWGWCEKKNQSTDGSLNSPSTSE